MLQFILKRLALGLAVAFYSVACHFFDAQPRC
jgi:hypothetical protein